MMFKDLKTGGTIFIYDKSAVTLSEEKAVNVSAPRIDNTLATGMVVDVTLTNRTYTFKDVSDVGYVGNLVLSADKSIILKEIETQKANNDLLLSRVDNIKDENPKLEALIERLSPERREKKQQEERFARIEDAINNLKEILELSLKQKANGSK